MPKFTINPYAEFDALDGVNAMNALLEKVNSVILLDAIGDHLLATASNEAEQFEADVLNHAIKEIRKSQGME